MGVTRFWSTSRARRAATAAIAPMVGCTRERFGAIPVSSWHEPYIVGFLTMLTSLFARRETNGRISSDGLGFVQAGTWCDITGITDDLIGEYICLLSANGERNFLDGCRNAAKFFDALSSASDSDDPDVRETVERISAGDCEPGPNPENTVFNDAIIAALWRLYFENRLS